MLPHPTGVPSTLPSPMTGTTTATAVRPSVGVLGGVLVLVRAVSQSSMNVTSISHSIQGVSRLGIPSQVLQSVIARVPVVMASLVTLGARTHERLQYNPMNRSVDHLPVSGETHSVVTLGIEGGGLHPSPPNMCAPSSGVGTNSVSTSDPSVIRDLVIRVADHGHPRL